VEWRHLREELVQGHAEPPDVGPRVHVARAVHLLGRHVERRSQRGARAGEAEIAVHLLGDAEVDDLDAVAVHTLGKK